MCSALIDQGRWHPSVGWSLLANIIRRVTLKIIFIQSNVVNASGIRLMWRSRFRDSSSILHPPFLSVFIYFSSVPGY